MFSWFLGVKFWKNAIKHFLVDLKRVDEDNESKNYRNYIEYIVVHIISVGQMIKLNRLNDNWSNSIGDRNHSANGNWVSD